MTTVRSLFFTGLTSLAGIGCSGLQPPSALPSRDNQELPVPNERIQKIADGLTEATLRCPERVWPNYSFSSTQALFFDTDTRQAWLWNARLQSGPLEPVPYSSIENRPEFSFSFGFLPWNGWQTLSLSVAESSERGVGGSLALGIHEGFHYYSQGLQGWPNVKVGRRGQVYPAEADPRYFRAQILSSLKKAYIDIDRRDFYLQEAAYWQSLYEEADEGESERLKAVRISEGTAEYVTVISMAIAELGCQATEADLRVEVLKKLDHWIPDSSEMIAAVIENDEYYVEAMAGLLLREQGGRDWERQIMAGATLVNLLLRNVTPSPKAEEDLRRRDQIEEIIDGKNQYYSKQISPLVSNYYSSDYVKISIDGAGQAAYFSTSGFVLDDRDFPDDILVMDMSTQLYWQGKNDDLEGLQVQGQHVLFQDINPCGPNQKVFVLPKNSMTKLPDNSYSLLLEGVAEGFFLPNKIVTDQDGEWICAGPNLERKR